MRAQAVVALQPQPATRLLSQPVGVAAQLRQCPPPRALWDGRQLAAHLQVGRKADAVGPRHRDRHLLPNLAAARICQLHQERILAGSCHLLPEDRRRRR